MRRWTALITVGALALLGAACDDDNGEEGSLAAYCSLVEGLDAQSDIPSAEQFEDLRQAAPDEIRDEVATASEAIEDEGEDAFNDPDVVAAIEDIEAYETQNCDQADGDLDIDTEDDVDVDVDDEDETDGTTGTTDTTDDADTTSTTSADTTPTTETTGTAPTTTANGGGANSLY